MRTYCRVFITTQQLLTAERRHGEGDAKIGTGQAARNEPMGRCQREAENEERLTVNDNDTPPWLVNEVLSLLRLSFPEEGAETGLLEDPIRYLNSFTCARARIDTLPINAAQTLFLFPSLL